MATMGFGRDARSLEAPIVLVPMGESAAAAATSEPQTLTSPVSPGHGSPPESIPPPGSIPGHPPRSAESKHNRAEGHG
jgi:hypothetical protein